MGTVSFGDDVSVWYLVLALSPALDPAVSNKLSLLSDHSM